MPYKDPEAEKAYQRAYRARRPKRVLTPKRRVYMKEYLSKYTPLYEEARYKEDPLYRMKKVLRARARKALKGTVRSVSTLELLGCTTEHLRAHLEAQFKSGMSWENYGPKGWHVDHIRPCASFDLTDLVQQRRCFHFTNLQPLWAEDNFRKGANYAQASVLA